MTDFHTHILPKMDDGSSGSAVSMQMLGSYPDEVDRVVFTPHFYPFEEEPESFLSRREASLTRLRQVMGENEVKCPKTLVGAELMYYEGLYGCKELPQFVITGTKLLLVEMPMKKWTGRMLNELIRIRTDYGIIPVLAHLNRYIYGQKCLDNLSELDGFLSAGGLVQINTEAFMSVMTRGRASELFRNGYAHFLGSDAHNMSDRRPNYGEALAALRKHRREDVIEIIKSNEEKFFG